MSDPHRPDSAAQSRVDTGCTNLHWCAALLDGLMASGLRLLVLSPGSRSTPVVLAAQQRSDLDIVPILDERSAAFFALGAACASNRPVALLATSGSAPAHWYPAVIEASEAAVPLVLLSADRPPRLRNWGANQTIDQTRLFGAFVRENHDPGLPSPYPAALKSVRALGLRAGKISLAPHPGPVHINLAFEEPLVPTSNCFGTAESTASQAAISQLPTAQSATIPPAESNAAAFSAGDPASLALPAGPGLIICGPGSFDSVFASTLKCAARRHCLPVLADPLSGLRFGPESDDIITCYDALLRNPEKKVALRPTWVLRFGRAPVSKRLGEWLNGIPTILIDPGSGWSDPNHDVELRMHCDPNRVCANLAASPPVRGNADADWTIAWLNAERRMREQVDRYLRQADWFEGHIIRTLLARIPSEEALLCANSMPIRQLDTWSGQRIDHLSLFGNRGVSGIDGQLSTLAGINHAGPPCWALLGDLSLCHDLSGLLQSKRNKRPIIVINNGGGRIFDYLPQHGLPGFELLWRTAVDIDLGTLAASVGLHHARIETALAFDLVLDQALDQAAGTSNAAMMIEILLDGDRSRDLHQEFWESIASDLPGEGCR